MHACMIIIDVGIPCVLEQYICMGAAASMTHCNAPLLAAKLNSPHKPY